MARQTDIRLRRSAVSGAVPGSADLNLGELALNTADGAIYVKNGSNNIVTVSHDGILHYDQPNSRIGIGTSTPAQTLHLTNTGFAYARLNNSSYTGVDIGQHTNGNIYINNRDNTSIVAMTNNTERLRIDSSGRLLLNATSTAFSDKLYVNGDAYVTGGWRVGTGATYTGKIYNSAGVMAIETDSNRDIKLGSSTYPNILYIDSSTQYVGIGTSTPRDLLDIVSSTSDARLVLDAAAGFDPELKFFEAGAVKFTVGHDSATSKFVIGTSNVDTQKRFTIDTSGAITFNEAYTFPATIGTAGQILKVPSVGTDLVWASDAGGGSATILTDTDSDTKIQVEESADEDIIRFDAAGIERFKIGSDVEVMGTTDFNITGSNRRISFTSGTGTVRTSGAYSLNLGTNSADRLTITSAGNVGIGTTDPLYTLDVRNPSDINQTFRVLYPDASTVEIGTSRMNAGATQGLFVNAQTLVKFGISGTEKMRLDSSGNLLVGKTADNNAVAGVALSGSGIVKVARTDWSLLLNRLTTDGELALFQKDGTSVGSIGTDSGDLTIYGTVAGHTGFRFGNGEVYPTNNGGSLSDNTMSLGSNSIRFKNLYLSGGLRGDTLTFSNLAGTERMRIDSSGNVGIGTSTPQKIHGGASLDGETSTGFEFIAGNSTVATVGGEFLGGYAFRNNDSSGTPDHYSGIRAVASDSFGSANLEFYAGRDSYEAGTSPHMTIRGSTNDALNGLVGIGTNAPSAILQSNAVAPTYTDASTVFFGSTTNNAAHNGIMLSSYGNALGGSVGSNLTYANSATPSQTNTGRSSGEIKFENTTGSGVTSNIKFGGYYKGTTSYTERMRIDASGNVGIGTSAPSEKLHVSGGNALIQRGTGTTSVSELGFTNAFDTAFLRSSYTNPSATTETYLAFHANTSGATNGTVAEQMRIVGNKVGIGTTAPNRTLHIIGQHTIENSTTPTGAFLFIPSSDANRIYSRVSNASSSSRDFAVVIGSSEAMRIDSSGNVGIGTTAPNEALEVKGSIRIDNGASFTAYQVYRDNILYGSVGGGSNQFTIQASNNKNINLFDDSGVGLTVKDGGNVGIGTTAPKAKLQVEEYGVDTTATSSAAVTQIVIHTFPAADFRSAKYTIQVTNTTDSTYHITEILMIHNGTTPSITEYGTIFTGTAAEATFDADILTGNVRLLATPAAIDGMEFKVVCHSITV